ncbi:MAG: hypothetical protein FJY73_13800 [Candidatus Eisenbacteria bacterium]|nr:hypothetical protein [Candidatus Eisenbacteria bacterium]
MGNGIRTLRLVTFVLAGCMSTVDAGFEGRPITTNAFLPTGYTLHEGEFTVGIGSINYGATEQLQFGTNLLLWIFQVKNADAKFSLLKDEDRAVAIGLGASHFSLNLLRVDGNGLWGTDEASFTTLVPYASASLSIGERTMGHLAGQFAYFRSDYETDDVEVAAWASGTGLTVGIEQALSDLTRLLADVGYDATFSGVRVAGGVLFGWDKFRLKLGLNYYSAGDGFFFPLVGIWWRFHS